MGGGPGRRISDRARCLPSRLCQRSERPVCNGPSKIASALRPLAKEVIKGGLLTYTALTDSLAGIGKQFTEMVDEAKAELAKKDPPAEKNSSGDSSS